MRSRILVIDDEEPITEILKYNLEKDGYEVDCAFSAEEALTMDLSRYSLFIVDIMMEKLSGFDFAKAVRKNFNVDNVPIIFCTALNGEEDTVTGLNIGGDDYITKPFVIPEVLARVRAVLRRSNIVRAAEESVRRAGYLSDVTFQDLRIDLNHKICTLEGRPINLTKTEFEILLFFLTNRNRIFSREEIIKKVWPNDVIVTPRTIDTNITRLRKKIAPYGNNIITRLGFGYGFKDTD